MTEFNFFTTPGLYFGAGKLALLPALIKHHGSKVLIITGARSFLNSEHWPRLIRRLVKEGIEYIHDSVPGEPSPEDIDGIVRSCRGHAVGVVTAIGGGSVVDAGKAVSAMLTKNRSVVHYLEGVGTRTHDGDKRPFIAVPTTAGTGSEATKNAVISRTGKNGFKKSLRHDRFIPDIAVVDPVLTLECPSHITAACGMDAFTQILESYLSVNANPMTDSLARGALAVLGDSLIKVVSGRTGDTREEIRLRTKIAYAATISGLTLANAGLGAVHGFASAIGGMAEVPHGVVCATLVGEVTKINIETLIRTDPDGTALKKYKNAADLLDPSRPSASAVEGARRLISLLEQWTDQMKIPVLSAYGVTDKEIDRILESTGQKNNPVTLTREQLSRVLRSRL